MRTTRVRNGKSRDRAHPTKMVNTAKGRTDPRCGKIQVQEPINESSHPYSGSSLRMGLRIKKVGTQAQRIAFALSGSGTNMNFSRGWTGVNRHRGWEWQEGGSQEKLAETRNSACRIR